MPFEGDLGIFDFINPEAEKGGESKALITFPMCFKGTLSKFFTGEWKKEVMSKFVPWE